MNANPQRKESPHWVKSSVANIVRYVPSGIYFAWAKVGGKLIRQSLKTDKLTVVQPWVGDLLKQYPKDGKVKLDGENVIAFPKLPDFQQVTLKVLRWEEKDKRFVIREAELVT